MKKLLPALIAAACMSVIIPASAVEEDVFMKDIMEKMDVNKDKKITKEEYLKYWEKKWDEMDKDKAGWMMEDAFMRGFMGH